jgi:pyruvate/2-oxoglutarate dehydrogenase complex dihydrolipoamide dehydrogenase (E3) component
MPEAEAFGASVPNEGEIQADEVLLSIGQVPNVEELDLETAGAEFDADQGIRVDDFLCSTNANVYAAGDVCLELKFGRGSGSRAVWELRAG